jgi:uncharacterized protein YidB (DUF937 family)
MGLMDVLQGMSNGPHGAPAQSSGRSHGVSPIAMGLLALLAYKSMKGGGLFGQAPAAPPAAGPERQPAPQQDPSAGGGLLGWLGGVVGRPSAGAEANVVGGGLNELLKRFEKNGLGDAGRSWIGSGPNKPVSPGDVEKAVGSDTLDALARELNMSRDELRQRLSAELPQSVDRLTPEGHVPLQQDVARPV